MSETRICLRTGCRQPAAASLSFRYASRQVWVAEPTDLADPSRYALCSDHADALTVPRGWECIDERMPSTAPRSVPGPPSEPDAPDPECAPPRAGAIAAAPRVRCSRYEPLLADLPRLAAEHRRANGRRTSVGSSTPPATHDRSEDVPEHSPEHSNEHAWNDLASELGAALGAGLGPDWNSALLAADPSPQVEGQLVIPVSGGPPVSGAGIDGGIVVPIEFAGVRRRGERLPTG